MKSLILAEVRKLLTIRSTYILAAIALLLIGFVSFWTMGVKGDPAQTTALSQAALTAGATSGIFMAITAILLITHEYRYNTIVYTLTASRSRSKVLAAKLIATAGYAVLVSALLGVAAVLLLLIGAALRDGGLAPQIFPVWDTVWRTVTFALGFALAGLLFGVLFRHVVGAIILLFIAPSTIESLLMLVLKENAKYLPFTALEQVNTGMFLKPAMGLLIFSAYLAGGWILAWILFLRRDAN